VNELNPNNPALMQMHDSWHKFVVILMMRYGLTEFEVTLDDVRGMADADNAVMLDARNQRLVLRLVSNEEAARLARKEGGLPV
jgi:hypothetical protein